MSYYRKASSKVVLFNATAIHNFPGFKGTFFLKQTVEKSPHPLAGVFTSRAEKISNWFINLLFFS